MRPGAGGPTTRSSVRDQCGEFQRGNDSDEKFGADDERQVVDQGGVRKQKGAPSDKVPQELANRPLVWDQFGRSCFRGGHCIAHDAIRCGYSSETFGAVSCFIRENGGAPFFEHVGSAIAKEHAGKVMNEDWGMTFVNRVQDAQDGPLKLMR